MSTSTLRIGIISDAHCGRDFGSQAGSFSFKLLQRFRQAMREFQPHVIIDLGDRINNESPTKDCQQLKKYVQALENSGCPLWSVPGNHDLVHMELTEIQRVVGETQCPRLRSIGNFPFILLNTEGKDPVGDELVKTMFPSQAEAPKSGPILVFSHRPLTRVPLARNPLFPPGMDQHVSWGETLLTALVKKGYYPVCINGHLHWNHMLIEKAWIQVSIPSLVETWESDYPSGSFAELTISSTGLELHVKGRLPAHYNVHWNAQTAI